MKQRDGQWIVQGDPTEGALIVAARKAGLAERLERRFARVGEVPFSSERKLMSTLHTDAETEGRVLLFTKGAPDVLLTRCTHELVGEERRPLSDTRLRQILEANDALAGRALRTLGVAYRASLDGTLTSDGIGEEVERDLVFAGLVAMIDPPRDEAREAVARAMTGRHPPGHDHRRSSDDRRRHCAGTRHRERRQGSHRRRARTHVGRIARRDGRVRCRSTHASTPNTSCGS